MDTTSDHLSSPSCLFHRPLRRTLMATGPRGKRRRKTRRKDSETAFFHGRRPKQFNWEWRKTGKMSVGITLCQVLWAHSVGALLCACMNLNVCTWVLGTKAAVLSMIGSFRSRIMSLVLRNIRLIWENRDRWDWEHLEISSVPVPEPEPEDPRMTSRS